MPQPIATQICCINPHCPRPYPQAWANRYCNSCGATLRLKNRYVPLQKLGEGGFATIYTVWDLELQTERVLKVLIEASVKALALFKQEADVLASLRHPGVPRVDPDGYFIVFLGLPQERQLPCLVMEKINGKTLAKILENHPQGCPQTWVVNWLNQAVEILQQLHNRHIIHRDIKPSNLMLRQTTAQLVLIDFGGAKQMAAKPTNAQASSTRLFSSGYSPPEQVAGGAVSATADFYALGRTMIEMLTGQYPSDLEDLTSGELRWRNHAPGVSPELADLLDDMVQQDVNRRPANANLILQRLMRFHKPRAPKLSFELLRTSLNWLRQLGKRFITGVRQTTRFMLRVAMQVVRASWDTTKGMVLCAIAAGVGSFIGFSLDYWSPLGAGIANVVSQQLSRLIPELQIRFALGIILFVVAGFSTALGLTFSGSFGQRRRYLIAPLMGIVAYGLGWIVWQAIPYKGIEAWMGLVAVATAGVTLGLGLPSYHLVHAVVAAVGSATVFGGLAAINLYPTVLLYLFSSPSTPSWLELLAVMAFFAGLGVTLSFWLGVSYYLFVPFLRLFS